MGFRTCIFCLLLSYPTVFSSPSCNPIDDCICIPGSSVLEVQCPKSAIEEYNSTDAYFVLHFDEEYKITQIDCKNTQSFRMDLLPNITMADKTTLELNFCPLPEENFKQISDHFLIDTLEKIQFENYQNLTLSRQYFEGLELSKLVFRHLGSVYIEEGAFSNNRNLSYLDISNNRNLTLNAKAFLNLPNLKMLYLVQNRLENLPNGLFKNMGNLKILNLLNNNLTSITDETFADLSSLTLLNLGTNEITTLTENAFHNLKNLSAVDLSKNKIRTISPNTFKNNKNLRKIFIQLNRGLQLSDYVFADLMFLKIVDLSRCNLQSIPEGIFANSKNLANINLGHNKLEKISPHLFQDLKNLEELDLGHNLISEINAWDFKDLASLKNLNLEKNRIVKIHYAAFYNMRHLIKINLSHNNISMEGEYMDIVAENRNIAKIDLSHNTIRNVHNVIDLNFKFKLQELDLSYNYITEIKLKKFVSSYALTVNLEDNNITKVNFESIDDTKSPGVSTIRLSGNPIDCNCDNYDLFQFLNQKKYKEKISMFDIVSDDVVCKSPLDVRGSKLVELPPSSIICDIKNSSACPLECSCGWRPFDTSMIVNCSERNLMEFPTFNHEELMNLFKYNQTEVHLQGNFLKSGLSGDESGWDNVTRLNLSNNKIKKIQWLPANLEVLHLDNNNITSLDHGVLSTLNKTKLTLHNNPWTCNCDTVTFSNFLRQHSRHVDVNNVKCHHNKTLLVHNLSEVDLCHTKLVFYIILPVLSLVLFITFLLFLFYRYQEPIKVWLFAHGYLLRWVTEEELDKDKEYDAFISYSHKDEEFIVQNLLPVLEGGPSPYKLCIHYRNFIPGEFISTQVTNSVLKSRRTLVVLSPNFLDSVWGKMEFRTAHMHAMTEGRARVIIVMYGDVDMEMLDDELKAYMKTNTYVKWGDPYFWNKLKYALPHSNRKTLKNGQKIANVMSCIDDKLNLVAPVTPSPGTTPPVLSVADSMLKKSPLDFVPRQEMNTPPAEAGMVV